VSGGYFHRLRALAAGPPPRRAASREAARPAEPLEHEEVRTVVAPAPTPPPAGRREEPTPTRAFTPRAPEPPPGDPPPAAARTSPPLSSAPAPAPVEGPPPAPASAASGPADRPRRSGRPSSPALPEVEVVLEAPSEPPPRPASAAPARHRSATPATASGTESPEPPRPARSPAPSPTFPPEPVADEAAPPVPLTPEEGLHEALVRVRRWMAEPAAEVEATAAPEPTSEGPSFSPQLRVAPRRTDARLDRPRAAAESPAPVEERTEVSIGTIHVTVEEPEGGPRNAGTRPAPTAAPQRPRAVPRHYVRGW